MKKTIILFSLFAIFQLANGSNHLDDIKQYQLENGLTIYLWEDHTAPDIFGLVSVKAGARNETEDATGMAHYLEHMIFKGTNQLGTSDWEKEKPHYEKIISLFEDYRNTENAQEKANIYKKINEESKLAGQYTIPNEFSNLLQSIGANGVNASTGYDMTMYYSSFPSFETERWLSIYAHLLENPVFRNFHTELETVFEEMNMYEDNANQVLSNKINAEAYTNHRYAITIGGKKEHLKNPSLKGMIEFYNKWYVPGNMALILCGNFNTEQVMSEIDATFGKWESKPVPKDPIQKIDPIEGKEVVKLNVTPYKMGYWYFNGMEAGNENQVAYELTMQLLSNKNQTGILDQLQLDGDVLNVGSYGDIRKDGGRSVIYAVPAFDYNQLRQISVGETEKMINKYIEGLKEGAFDNDKLEVIKKRNIQDFNYSIESNKTKAMVLRSAFDEGKSVEETLNYPNKINAVTKEDIIKIANVFLTKDHITFQCLEGTHNKEHYKKPDFDVIDSPKNAVSDFAKEFKAKVTHKAEKSFIDFEKDIVNKEFTNGVEYYYNSSTQNNIFTLSIKYGVGTKEKPLLEYAIPLMNQAGVLAQFEPEELKQEFGRLNCAASFSVNDDYTYVTMRGDEANLEAACRLLSKVMLMPKLDVKQKESLIAGVLGSRRIEKTNTDSWPSALYEYLLYQNESHYVNRTDATTLKTLSIKNLTGEFIRATQYEAEIHYSGNMEQELVFNTLKSSLAFNTGLKPTNSPTTREIAKYKDNTIYFMNDKDALQSQIFIYIPQGKYDLKEDAILYALNEYLGGGFNGIVLQEIREYNAMAYTASGSIVTPVKNGYDKYFLGYVGTQADKTANAVELYVNILQDLPKKPERMVNVKQYLENMALTNKPPKRYLSQNIVAWKTLGYNQDPAKELLPQFNNLTFDEIYAYYDKNIKGKPITIAIIGDKKQIDFDKLESLGKVKPLNPTKLFK